MTGEGEDACATRLRHVAEITLPELFRKWFHASPYLHCYTLQGSTIFDAEKQTCGYVGKWDHSVITLMAG
jgi:hypothetical protein